MLQSVAPWYLLEKKAVVSRKEGIDNNLLLGDITQKQKFPSPLFVTPPTLILYLSAAK